MLKGANVIITGAGRGIGKSTALLFAEQGANCVLVSRTASDLAQVAAEIEKKGGRAFPLESDISNDEHVSKIVQDTISTFGSIEILINNAGLGWRNDVVKARVEDWDQTLAVNLRGAMRLTQKVLPVMMKKRNGVIINISSISGKIGYAGSSAYCASKFGLMGFTEALFKEVRNEGIKVSVICPGYVDTSLIPNTRKIDRSKMIDPHDIAKACLFVATSSAVSCPTEIVILPQRNPEC